MKSKRIRYLLVFLVIMVWSVIFYRIYNYVDDGNDFVTGFSEQKLQSDTSNVNDTFSIQANYRDPFLETGNYTGISSVKSIYNNASKVVKIQNANQPVNAVLRWPSIVFGGMVVNKKSSQVVGLIKLNQVQYIVHAKQLIENIEIVTIYNDSITVRFADEIKTIKKSK